MSIRPIPRLEIRHLERQKDTVYDEIIQSATRLLGQACTNRSKAQNESKWRQPLAKPLTSIGTASSVYTLRELPPTRQSLLQTLSSVSSSNSLALLEWGTPFAESEYLGLPGLEEFRSGINWSVRRSSAVVRPVQSLAKRRRSTESIPQVDTALPKRKRPLLENPASSRTPAVPTPVPPSRIHGLVPQHDMPRLRLGLRKRLGMAQNQSSGAPVHVKMTSKRQLGPGPLRVMDTEEPLELSVAASSNSEDNPSIKFTSRAIQHVPSTSRIVPQKGIVLVPSSPSPIVSRTTAPVSRTFSWTSSHMGASVLYDSSPDSSPDRILRSRIPVSRLYADDSSADLSSQSVLLPATVGRDSGLGSLAAWSASAPTEAPEELSKRDDYESEHDARHPTCATQPCATQKEPNQMMASVMYDSSQSSVVSCLGEPSKLHTTYGSLALPSSFDKDFSSQKTNGSGSWDISDPHLTNSRTSNIPDPILPSASPRADQTHATGVILGTQDTANKSNHGGRTTGLGLISAFYDSSQDDPNLSGSQQSHPSPQELIPSWSTYKSSQNDTPRLLSGARPSSSWSIPSVEGLVAASRSLSLEDFENQVRRPSSDGPTASHEKSLSEKSLSHSQLEENLIKSILHAPHLMHPEVSRLASYVSTEDSIRSPTPSLPQPSKRSVDDDSIESINSPLPDRTGLRGDVRGVPAFRLPGPELEDDISFESQKAHKSTRLSPVHLGNSDSPPEVIDSSASDQRTSVPRFDALPAPDGRSPQAGSTAETEITHTQQQSHPVILSTPNHQTALNHPALGAAAQLARPTSKIYKGSLHNIIRQPHFLPSLSCPSPSLTEGMLAALEVSSVHTWFDEQGKPKATPSEEFAWEPWKRVAWIIPVRGRPPWEGCSSAAISSRPIVKARKKRTILWTSSALRSLWAQLEGFRESKRVGSLSISFEPAQTDQAFEFVKVYHEAKVSLKLRTIMKVLEFPDCDGHGINAEVAQEDEGELGGMRRLLGSSTRLALVDEVGRIVLVA